MSGKSAKMPLAFIAGAAFCCLLCVSASCYFVVKGVNQGLQSFAEMDEIANSAYGKPYDMVINQLQSKYISSGLRSAVDIPQAVLVYRMGDATVGVPNRKDVYVGLGVDDNNVVRKVMWYKNSDGWPSTIIAKNIVTVQFL